MRRLVILRPEPGASATLARASAAGIEAVAIPLFAVAPVEWLAPDASRFDALLLTSANAVRFGGAQLAGLRELPAYCVGEATAIAAREAGFAVAGTGASDATALIERVPRGLELLHLTARDHRAIAGVTTIVVYENATIDPPPSLEPLAGGVAMIHSPRAAARLADLVEAREDISIAAISEAAAAACGSGWHKVAAITAPGDGALLALAAALCQKR